MWFKIGHLSLVSQERDSLFIQVPKYAEHWKLIHVTGVRILTLLIKGIFVKTFADSKAVHFNDLKSFNSMYK